MIDPLSTLPVEEPLSGVEWQPLVLQHAVYAQRRYRYHTRLLAYGLVEFAPSLRTFQQLTQRAPERFEATAIASLQRIGAKSTTDESARLWHEITSQPYEHTDSVGDVVNLPDLYESITSGASFLKSQKKKLASTSAKSDPGWHSLITALTVLIEELADPQALPVLSADAELLAPYPDAAAWQALIASDPRAATMRFADLLLQNARVGLRMEFNARESMAIYRTLRGS